MRRIGIFLLAVILLAGCKDKTKGSGETEGGELTFDELTKKFKEAKVPYQLTDSSLLQNKDTTTLNAELVSGWLPDSIEQKLFGKNAKVKYTPLVKVEVPKAETYLIIKGVYRNTRAALLLAFDNKQQLGSVLPFLVPDTEAATTQVSSIDKSYTISKNITRILPDDAVADGKEVYVYSNDVKQFTLIMTDVLDEQGMELINPIDTLSKQNKLAGDFAKDKKNIVSVRDGRKPNTLTVFIHIEQKGGECTGEIKGEAQITSANKAIYQQAGDPCVLELNFGKTGVTLNEIEGCGSRRGLECSFNGTFKRKKEKKEETEGKGKKENTSKR